MKGTGYPVAVAGGGVATGTKDREQLFNELLSILFEKDREISSLKAKVGTSLTHRSRGSCNPNSVAESVTSPARF